MNSHSHIVYIWAKISKKIKELLIRETSHFSFIICRQLARVFDALLSFPCKNTLSIHFHIRLLLKISPVFDPTLLKLVINADA
jgi:hypothetical protein